MYISTNAVIKQINSLEERIGILLFHRTYKGLTLTPTGFMGIADHMLEMLFIGDEYRGQGMGKELLQYGIDHYAVNKLAVNEQNPLAKGFYEHMGFEVYKRTELDEQGEPYPLLYMQRIEKEISKT